MNPSEPRSGATSAPATPPGGLGLPRLGRYQARRVIGSGGSGTVYSALDTVSGAKVALKVLLRHEDHLQEEARQRFLRESRLTAAVKSPHVVEYLDAGCEGDELYLVTELLTGGDAHGLCKRYPQGMPVIMAAAIGRDCARGLAAIHAAGFIHRDVKPSNIFLGATGIGKIGDLGLARSLETPSSLTVYGNLLGTPDFMAPEQAMPDEAIDHRADIYALSSCIFFLLTGRPPHVGKTAWAVLAQLITDPFPDPRADRADLPAGLVRVLLKAGAKDPAQRYQDADALAMDLDAVITDREPSAGEIAIARPAITQPARPTPSKHRTVLLVDDDPIICRLYRTRFEQEGFTVTTASDGKEALAKAAATKPDVALLDFMLPGDDGLTVLRNLRTMPGLERIPAMMFSSSFMEEHRESARQLGITQVLSKSHCTPRQVAEQLIALTMPGDETGQHPRLAKTAKDDQISTGIFQLAQTTLLRLQVLLGRLGHGVGIEGDRLVLAELAATAHGLAAAAGTVQAARSAMVAEATEHLARQLLDQGDHLTPSSLRTIGQALAGLRRMLPGMHSESFPSLHAVVVDDDPLSLQLVCRALGKASIRTTSFQDPLTALARLPDTPADLIVSDVMMSGMNGMQFANRLRDLPDYRTTPVLFVTGLADFASSLAEMQDPRMDVIAKPILLGELATKALVMALTPA